MKHKVYHSRDSDEWGTPPEIFQPLLNMCEFTFDAAASSQNKLLLRYCSIEKDFFAHDLSGESVWCNPPFSRMRDFVPVLSMYDCVMLCAARTDTVWWHTYCRRFFLLQGRVSFLKNGLRSQPAPFPCALVVFGDNMWRTFTEKISGSGLRGQICCVSDQGPVYFSHGLAPRKRP